MMRNGVLMNHVERFRAVMSRQPVDRLPAVVMWWDKTIDRWHGSACGVDGCL